jgi:nitrogen fixation protein
MKRKVVMLGLAMVTGLPQAVCAKDASRAHSSWNTSYMPHYGVEGAEKPLMDHVSVASVSAPAGQGISNTWRLAFTPLPTVSNADAPLTAKDMRAGFSLKRDF